MSTPDAPIQSLLDALAAIRERRQRLDRHRQRRNEIDTAIRADETAIADLVTIGIAAVRKNAPGGVITGPHYFTGPHYSTWCFSCGDFTELTIRKAELIVVPVTGNGSSNSGDNWIAAVTEPPAGTPEVIGAPKQAQCEVAEIVERERAGEKISLGLMEMRLGQSRAKVDAAVDAARVSVLALVEAACPGASKVANHTPTPDDTTGLAWAVGPDNVDYPYVIGTTIPGSVIAALVIDGGMKLEAVQQIHPWLSVHDILMCVDWEKAERKRTAVGNGVVAGATS